MNGRYSPGQRARLAALGLDERKARFWNRATKAAERVTVDKSIKIPTNATELAEMIADKTWLSNVAKDQDTLFSVMAEYGERQQGEGTELRRTISEQAQAAAIEWLKDNEITNAARFNLDPQTSGSAQFSTARQAATGYNAAAPGAALDKEFASSGEFFRNVWHGHRAANPEAAAKMSKILNAYQSAVGADGGYLIPEVLRSRLLQLSLESALVRPRATVIPMDSLRVAMPMIDATTNVGSVVGGMVAYWTEEGAAMVDTSAKFGQVMLEANTLTGYSEVPNQLMADSIISFSAFIETAWPKAIAWYEDLAFISGSGVGEPLGFLGANNPGSIAIAAESGQATSTILWENIVNMFARMLPSSLNSAVWVVSPDTFPQLATMALSVGTGGAPVWLSNGAAGPPMTILGRPVYITEKVSRLGTRGDIAFVDLSYYLVGDRQTMSADTSEHFRFSQNKTAFRIIERVDGRPWLQSAITPANSGPTLSPFVELATRP